MTAAAKEANDPDMGVRPLRRNVKCLAPCEVGDSRPSPCSLILQWLIGRGKLPDGQREIRQPVDLEFNKWLVRNLAVQTFDLEDDRPEPIGAAGYGRSWLFHGSQVSAGSNGFDLPSDIGPGPGAESLRYLVPHINIELLPIFKAVAGADLAFNSQILIGDILVDGPLQDCDLAL